MTNRTSAAERVGSVGEIGREERIVKYGALGAIEIRRNGVVVDIGGYKQRALVALLLINANSVVSTDRIIDELWGESDGNDRQNALWTGVSRLRSALEPDRPKRTDGTILVTQPPGYVLNVDPADTDAGRFEALALEGRSLLDTDPGAGSLVLAEALSLWRGHAYEEFTYEPFAAPEVERLEELRLAAVEDRVDADLRTGRSRELIGELESLVRQHPFRQRLAGHLMLALHLSGRQGDALRAFGSLRTRLAEELGLDPSAALSKLEERIVLDDPTLGESHAARALTGRDEPGLSVRGYELRDKVGAGPSGHLYRAFQPAVGREVAIKVVRPELANDPDFIRRFEAEAQLIASLEHPQIVPVFDYWREPDAAFLVMRRFEHGSLRDALERGPLETSAAVHVLSQVGGALAAAHRRAVVHGDLRPDNVLLDGDGNAYLGDFAMSFRHQPAGDGNDGPDVADTFVAPEQRASGEATQRSDIYSFGALAEFALRGAAGNGGLPESPLVGPVAGIVGRAMADDPADRFADVDAFLDAMATAFGEPSIDRHDDHAELLNPYRGLRAFSERDAEQFFGRERLVERLVTRLGNTGPQGGFVALVGPSGSGKSSVVRAGVVPALRNGAVTGSESWFVVSMTPGRHPFEELDEALRTVAVRPPHDLLERLATIGISAAVESISADPSAQTVIIVDQLEELFSQASSADANAFLDALAAAASDRHSGVKVVATLRADFYDHPLRHGAFGELLRLGTEVITPMSPQELDRAITAPAAALGVSFEPGLVASILADMSGQSTALPLLQYALTELFEQRSGRVVTADAYRELGGVSAALARRADALYDGLEPDERTAVRDLFLRLASLDDHAADTRRRALVSELTDVAGDDVAAVLETFGRHRLLTFDRDPITRGPTVEIAHEALLTEWTRLRHWIDDARSDIKTERRLALAAAEWSDRGRDVGYLMSGARLGRYDGWLERPPVRLTSLEHEFLDASSESSDEELRVERARVGRLRRLVGAVGVALVVAMVAGGIAFVQRQRASDEADRAEAQTALAVDAAADAQTQTELAVDAAGEAEAQTELAVQAAAEAETQTALAEEATNAAELATLISRSAAARIDDPDLAVLLALEADARSGGSAQAVLGALTGSQLTSRIASREPLVDDCLGIGVVPPGGGGAEFATVDGRMLGRDLVTGETRDVGPPPGECALGFRNEEGGTALDVRSGTRVWLGANWEVQLDFDVPTYPNLQTADRVSAVQFFADRTSVILLDARTGEQVGESFDGGFQAAQALSADESLMAFGFSESNIDDDGTVLVLDPSTGTEVLRLVVADAVAAMAFDPDGGDLIVALRGGMVLTFDPRSGAVLDETVTDQVTSYATVGFLADGSLVLVGRDSISLLDRETGERTTAVELQNVATAFVRPEGYIITSNDSGQRDVYDLGASALIERSWDADGISAAAPLDGFATVISRPGDSLEVIDLDTGDREQIDLRLPDGGAFVPRLAYADSDGIWALSEDLVLGRWEGSDSLEMVDMLEIGSGPDVGWFAYGAGPSGARFGDYLAVPGLRWDGTGERPNEATEAILVDLSGASASVAFRVDVGGFWAHPTIDGGMFVADRQGTLRTFGPDGDLIGEPIETNDEPYAMALSADGSTLAMGSLGLGESFENSAIFVLDVASGELHRVPVEGLVSTIGVDDDGSQVVLAMFDGSVRLYDVESRSLPTIVYDGSGTFTSQPGWYDAETTTMWIHADGKLLQIQIGPDRWVELACRAVSRELTQDEWDRLVPGDEPLRSACG